MHLGRNSTFPYPDSVPFQTQVKKQQRWHYSFCMFEDFILPLNGKLAFILSKYNTCLY